MTSADWEKFAEIGDSWDPAGRGRAILLEANDVLFMPPGVKVTHAVLTLDPSLMQGGMLWDDLNLDAILEGLHWIGLPQHATNEAMAWQLGEVLDELRDVRFNACWILGVSAGHMGPKIVMDVSLCATDAEVHTNLRLASDHTW
nr:hypothetical protein B0A51_00903 [Rachicladosporium sp. CCFEE 5018]